MNERIRQLGEQVGWYMKDTHYGGFPNESLPSVEKFVKLIVEESIEVMKKHDYHGAWLGEKLKEYFEIK